MRMNPWMTSWMYEWDQWMNQSISEGRHRYHESFSLTRLRTVVYAVHWRVISFLVVCPLLWQVEIFVRLKHETVCLNNGWLMRLDLAYLMAENERIQCHWHRRCSLKTTTQAIKDLQLCFFKHFFFSFWSFFLQRVWLWSYLKQPFMAELLHVILFVVEIFYPIVFVYVFWCNAWWILTKKTLWSGRICSAQVNHFIVFTNED